MTEAGLGLGICVATGTEVTVGTIWVKGVDVWTGVHVGSGRGVLEGFLVGTAVGVNVAVRGTAVVVGAIWLEGVDVGTGVEV